MGGEFYATKSFNNYINGLNQIKCIDDVYKPSYLSPWIANGSLSIRHAANTLFKFHSNLSNEIAELDKCEVNETNEADLAQYSYLKSRFIFIYKIVTVEFFKFKDADFKQIKSAKVQRIKHFIAGLLWRDYFHFLYFKYQSHWYKLGGIQGKTAEMMKLNGKLKSDKFGFLCHDQNINFLTC